MASRISQPTRQRLVALLSGKRLDGASLMERLRQLRRLDGVATCSAMLHLLTHLDLPEEEAEQLLVDMDDHRREVGASLGRDPGLRVAAVDYLSNVRSLLTNPTIVEIDDLETTERSAVTDSLTGLHNRGYFDSALEIETRRSMRYGLDLSLVLFDLDHFKPINDLHGHRFGDQVLAHIGTVIRAAVREADLACRFGGEEFAVILPETGRLGAHSLAQRVRRNVHLAFCDGFEGAHLRLTLSGGVATFPLDGEDAETVIENADRALYLAKTSGRDRVVLFHSERRRFVRYPVLASARVWLRSEETGKPLETRPINLSRTGVLLSASNEARPTGAVELRLQVRDREWTIPGEVVRRDRRGLAVRFQRPLPDDCFDDSVRRSSSPKLERG